MPNDNLARSFLATFRLTDAERSDELARVLAACAGNRLALTIVVEAFGPPLLAQARATLGPDFVHEAPDVLQDLWLALAEGTLRFTPGAKGASEWLIAAARAIATTRRDERHRDWGIEG